MATSMVVDDINLPTPTQTVQSPYDTMRQIVMSGARMCVWRYSGSMLLLTVCVFYISRIFCAAGGDLEEALVKLPERGAFGYAAYKNEPWSLQSYQKRKYALNEFCWERVGRRVRLMLAIRCTPHVVMCSNSRDAVSTQPVGSACSARFVKKASDTCRV